MTSNLTIITDLFIIIFITAIGVGLLADKFQRVVKSLEKKESALKEANEHLQISEERYRSLVEFSPLSIIVQVQGTIVYVNPTAQSFAAQNGIGDLLGRSDLAFLETNSQELTLDSLDNLTHRGQPYLGENKLTCLNGRILDIEVVSVAVPYKSKSAIMTMWQDITDRRQAEENAKKYNEVLRSEMELAAKVQVNLLLTGIPQIPGFKVAWEFKPSSYISGDMFNIFVLDDCRLGFYMLDVMGNGLPAALQAVSISYILKPFFRTNYNNDVDSFLKPSITLKLLHQNFTNHALSGNFFTIFYGVLNTETLELTYARAGHPAPIVLSRGDKIDELQEGGLPIGLFNNSTYEDYTYHLKQGDKLLVFTNGIIENNKHGGFDREDFLSFMTSHINLEINTLLKAIMDKAIFSEKGQQTDDIALLGIEIV